MLRTSRLNVWRGVILLWCSYAAAQESTVTCLCTTSSCQERRELTCTTSGLCYTQFLDKKDGANPVTRGCVNRKTPLLCENRRPAGLAQHRWPTLNCCRDDYCNQHTFLDLITAQEQITEHERNISITDGPSSNNASSDGSSKSSLFADDTVVIVFGVGITVLISMGIIGSIVLHRQR